MLWEPTCLTFLTGLAGTSLSESLSSLLDASEEESLSLLEDSLPPEESSSSSEELLLPSLSLSDVLLPDPLPESDSSLLESARLECA